MQNYQVDQPGDSGQIYIISMQFLKLNRRRSLTRMSLAAGSDERRLYSQANTKTKLKARFFQFIFMKRKT